MFFYEDDFTNKVMYLSDATNQNNKNQMKKDMHFMKHFQNYNLRLPTPLTQILVALKKFKIFLTHIFKI